MNKEINKIITNLENCFGIFDYSLTPTESNLLVSYIKELQQENQQLKEQLLVTQDNEETFRLEMEDITQTLGLDEDALFDDVKAYAGSLKDNWNKLKECLKDVMNSCDADDKDFVETILDIMQEIEKGSDINDSN
jgi:hypothetical protein